MTAEVVNERNILSVVQPLVGAAQERVWVTAPWVTTSAADLFFDELVTRLRNGEPVDVRLVYRLKGADDLSISDLDALDRLAAAGVNVRYSNRLHAKLVIIDGGDAVVSSSNLTSTAGYSVTAGQWQNEEVGVHLRDEAGTVATLAADFEAIWEAAHSVSEHTVGITMDQTTSETVRVACLRPPVVGEFVAVGIPARTIGTVRSVSSYNPTVPAEAGETDVLLGLKGGGGGRRSQVPDVETLFSHPSKTHAFLMSQTFVRPSATYHVANVTVLRSIDSSGTFTPSLTAVEPGEVVTEADPALLDQLISGAAANRVELGHLPANPSVRVTFDLDRLLSLHIAILGMTGTGKSNAVKVITERALGAQPDLTVVIVDTHGEYAFSHLTASRLTVRFEPCLRDEEWVKRAARAGRQLNDVMEEIEAAIEDLGPAASLADIADVLENAAGTTTLGARLKRLASAIRSTPKLCVNTNAATVIETHLSSGTAGNVDWAVPGLYVLDLLQDDSVSERIRRTGAVAASLLRHAKRTAGAHPTLFVVDEAQNYAPEQQTGRLGAARPSFEPIFEIATEGRKFHLGLLISSQRPARVNKDVLSQCNTQLIFRMVSVEDLGAVRESFESASDELLRSLPNYPTGTCYAAGAALAMGVQIGLPLV